MITYLHGVQWFECKSFFIMFSSSEFQKLIIDSKYKRVRRVGGGGFANVYEGYLLADPSGEVAIKVLKDHSITYEQVCSEVTREEKNLLRIGSDHPNIVQFLGISQNDTEQ